MKTSSLLTQNESRVTEMVTPGSSAQKLMVRQAVSQIPKKDHFRVEAVMQNKRSYLPNNIGSRVFKWFLGNSFLALFGVSLIFTIFLNLLFGAAFLLFRERVLRGSLYDFFR